MEKFRGINRGAYKVICNVLVSAVFITLLASCGKDSGSNEPDAKAPIGNIQIDPYVSQGHRDAMALALSTLDSSENWQSDGRLTAIMGLRNSTGLAIHQWLEDRVQYILDESFDVDKRLTLANRSYSYENPNDFPNSQNPNGRLSDTQTQVLGLNIGTSIYLIGKQNHYLLGLNISRIGNVIINSPRTGLIEVGSGAFFRNSQDTVAKAFVLGVMFHEARHGDGHGKTVGFTHAICPKGHQYEAAAACDNNLNGPYSVQAEFIRNVIQNCSECSAGQKEFLKLVEADSASRVIPLKDARGNTLIPQNWDDQPEGHR